MISIPASSLPSNPAEIDAELHEYFPFDLLPVWTHEGETIDVELVAPPTAAFYIDPRLAEGLHWWATDLQVIGIPTARRDTRRCHLSLNDAWTLRSWSSWLRRRIDEADEPDDVVVLHVDDHEDLMSPRVIGEGERIWDAITGAEVIVDEPESVDAAIRSGAIGMGSFIVPLLYRLPRLQVRHLKATSATTGLVPLAPEFESDTLLRPGAPRLSSIRGGNGPTRGGYMRTNETDTWCRDLGDSPVLLHIDMDYFNNRFNGDSDWRTNPSRHDPNMETVTLMIDEILNALTESGALERIEDITVGISPGFFPGEFWAPAVERIIAFFELPPKDMSQA